jgi:outer membrane protein assembly factor BamA
LEYGPEALGSDLRFIRYLAQQYRFQRLGEGIVLASAFRLGAGRGFGQDLIPSERFYAGGGTSVRGFAEGSLGGLDFLGDPVGGNGLLLLNQEIRFPLYRWVRGVGFVDAGNVFRRASDLSLTNLEAGAGFGLRIDTPFALLRIDFGLPLTGREPEPVGRWYFAIGQTF